jgi:hypothetical protein
VSWAWPRVASGGDVAHGWTLSVGRVQQIYCVCHPSTSIPGAAASQSRALEATASAASGHHSKAATGTGTTTSTPADASTATPATGGTSWAAGRGGDDLLHRGWLRDLTDPSARPAFGLETIHALTHWRVYWTR